MLRRLMFLLALATVILSLAQTSKQGNNCYSYALHLGIDAYGEEGWIELQSEKPLILVIHRIIGIEGKTTEASLKLTFKDGACTIEGMGFNQHYGYKDIPVTPNNLTQYRNDNKYVDQDISMESFEGYCSLEYKGKHITDGIKYKGDNETFLFNCKTDSPIDKFTCECSVTLKTNETSKVPMWVRAWDLDGDNIPEHCFGRHVYRFLGIEIFSKTPEHFKEFKKFTDALISVDFRDTRIFEQGYNKTILLK